MKTKTGRFLLIGTIVALLLIALDVYLLRAPGKETQPVPQQSSLMLDPFQATEAASAPEEPNVAIPGWAEITIPANQTEISSVDFYNPEANAGWYYLTFEIRINDISIYQSGLIEPGNHIQQITLSQPLQAGQYSATVFVQPYRISDNTPTNSASCATRIIAR